MPIEVSHYGVHWGPGDIAFLHQARHPPSNALGVTAQSPFAIRTKRRWPVNHLLTLNATNPARTHLDLFQAVLGRNSLARLLLPLPKDASVENPSGVGVLPVADSDAALSRVLGLLKMSSPIKLPVMRASLANPKTVLEELDMTNVQPLVLAGVDMQSMGWVREIAQQAALSAPRRLLIMASPDLPMKGIQRVEMDDLMARNSLDLGILPWETMGSIVLRAYMRKEWDGNWFTREPIPGNEQKMREARPQND